MNIILAAGILLIILSLVFQKNKKFSPYWGFVLIFLIMGFQEGIEGDFMTYKAEYQDMAQGIGNSSATAGNDTVWLFLNGLFSKFLPFWMFVILLAAFECIVLYKLGNKYGSRQYGWLGPVLFYFTFYLMLIQMKALRQGFAVEIIVLAYLMTGHKRGWLWGGLLTFAAVFVHHSTLIVIPFIILHFVVSKIKDIDKVKEYSLGKPKLVFPIIMVAAFMFVYTLKSTALSGWLDQLALIGNMNDVALSNYLETEQEHAFEISFLIVLYDAIMVFICSWFLQRTTIRYKILAFASIIGCYGDMLLFGMGSLPRIMMFYIIFNIITYPLIAEMVHKRFSKTAALIFIVFLVGYAMKTSLPMIMSSDKGGFGTYQFVFW